ncbi:MAG: hypothetical protein GY913_26335 [Proteobacteria bacterium]|nr:hypothetical protein [Pseudomonadota bacterium]MCP4920435.1 hypothetical protein [Pseudomonadota bacterium]
MLLLLSLAHAGKVYEDLALVNRAPVAPGQVLLFHRGDTSPKRVMLRSDGDTARLRRVGSVPHSYQLYRVPKLDPGTYAIVYVDAWGDERTAGQVTVGESVPVETPQVKRVETSREE